MRKFFCLLLLLPIIVVAQDKAALSRVEGRIGNCCYYDSLFRVCWCENDSVLCNIDSLNILATDHELNRLFRKGNSIQRTAAFVLISTRSQSPCVCRKMLDKMIGDTTRYIFIGVDDWVEHMPVGCYCFYWARQQGWATDDMYPDYTKHFDGLDIWPDNKVNLPDDQGHFTRTTHGWPPSPPEFPGGQKALLQFLKDNVHYPPAFEEDVQGRTICQFIVEKDGSISNIEVVYSSGDERLDAEAVRVLSIMPLWTPAKTCGKPQRMMYAVPVKFCIQEKNSRNK